MNNPIIEKLRGSIQDPRTAEYFSEVLSCYYSGNLRSAVVMLYATTICDLVYKLEDLKDIYNDNGAKSILDKLEKQQQENPKNTDWEKEIPEKCKELNKILTTADYSNFCSLQQLRHLCAHPVLSEQKELYKPNADIVLGHIRNMLEGVFIKPAFRTKELLNMFVKDIANIKDILVDNKQFEQYVNSKYFDKFNSEELEYSIFKSLWKFVFKLDNEQCNDNRKVNLHTLFILLSRHNDFIRSKFEADKEYFAKNTDVNTRKLFVPLIKIFNEYPTLFEVLPEAKKIEIRGIIDNDTEREYKSISLFLHDDMVKSVFGSSYHIHSNVMYVVGFVKRKIGIQDALSLKVKLYGESYSYDEADELFNCLIDPSLKDFSLEQLKQLVEYSNYNSQIYDRRKASSASRSIRDALLKKDPHFDFSQYPHF